MSLTAYDLADRCRNPLAVLMDDGRFDEGDYPNALFEPLRLNEITRIEVAARSLAEAAAAAHDDQVRSANEANTRAGAAPTPPVSPEGFTVRCGFAGCPSVATLPPTTDGRLLLAPLADWTSEGPGTGWRCPGHRHFPRMTADSHPGADRA